ncbi:MAG: hypothetical protein OSB00_16240, partial [Sphingomonas bacterium]|nr:hypothetical protein [Sphingomonas bacterium]
MQVSLGFPSAVSMTILLPGAGSLMMAFRALRIPLAMGVLPPIPSTSKALMIASAWLKSRPTIGSFEIVHITLSGYSCSPTRVDTAR